MKQAARRAVGLLKFRFIQGPGEKCKTTNKFPLAHLFPSSSYINQNFIQPIAQFATSLMLVSCLAYSLTLKMEATRSSKMLVDFQWITWCYIPEESTLHNHHFEKIKCDI
jgi:hypothetical protein